jgi:hypothetical protein
VLVAMFSAEQIVNGLRNGFAAPILDFSYAQSDCTPISRI